MTNRNLISRSIKFFTAVAVMVTFIFSVPAQSVSAAQISAPKLSVYAVFGDRIALNVDNLSSYPANTKFEISVSGKYLKTVRSSSAKTINLYNGKTYFKPNTNYTITVKPVIGTTGYGAASIKVKTDKLTYFKLDKGVSLYKLSGGRMKLKSSASKKTYFSGSLVTSNGTAIAGMSVKSGKGEYVKIKDGDYKGYYAAAADVSRSKKVTAQRYIVSEYGRSMNGGSYVMGAAQFKRTDCSGLTMQCYEQIGVSIPHNAARQSSLGKSVSLNNMQPGDIIVMNYKSHVGMYIGGGKMVHAMNPSRGIRVEPISKLQYYHVDTVRRLIY